MSNRVSIPALNSTSGACDALEHHIRAPSKRALDFIVSSLLVIVLSPLMIAIAMAIKVADRGPVLFSWRILGIGGRPIRSYKFRTMVPDAEEMEGSLREQGRNEMKSVYFKMRQDPRVTPLGHVLRKFSLDELPSLWSVVKGDMSLVGPRPVRHSEAQYLKDWHFQRFAVRPGLTSPWVIGGKMRHREFDDVAASDIDYIHNWSIWRDFQILLETASYIFSGNNH